MENLTAAEQVTNLLREKIFNGEIEDETELTQNWIAEQLGVSRMPIREALQNLELEGYIERLDNRHTRVIGFSRNHILARLSYLALLEGEAVRGVLHSGMTASWLDRVGVLLDDMALVDSELQYHVSLFEASGNRYLNQMFRKSARPTVELFIRRSWRAGKRNPRALQDIAEFVRKEDIPGVCKVIDSYFLSFKEQE